MQIFYTIVESFWALSSLFLIMFVLVLPNKFQQLITSENIFVNTFINIIYHGWYICMILLLIKSFL